MVTVGALPQTVIGFNNRRLKKCVVSIDLTYTSTLAVIAIINLIILYVLVRLPSASLRMPSIAIHFIAVKLHKHIDCMASL